MVGTLDKLKRALVSLMLSLAQAYNTTVHVIRESTDKEVESAYRHHHRRSHRRHHHLRHHRRLRHPHPHQLKKPQRRYNSSLRFWRLHLSDTSPIISVISVIGAGAVYQK